jgi:biopolymer transport protein ExbB
MTYVMTVALLLLQAAPDDPPDPLNKGAKPAAAGNVDDLLKEPGAKPAPPAGTAGAPGQPQDFKPAGPEGAPAGQPAAPAASSAEESKGASSTEAAVETNKSFSKWWDEVSMTGAMGLMRRGGVYMWPILVLGILAIATIIERYRSLKMLTTDSTALRAQVRELLQADRIEEALAVCENAQGPVAAILETGVRKLLVLRRLNYDAGRIEEQVVKAMDDYGVHIVAALERHLPILATVSSAAPMLGFLGTVSGMITSFDDIVKGMGQKNIVELASAGIAEALITTEAGLVFGIPAYIAFNYFTGVINRFVLDVEESASELIETVTLQMALDEREKTVEKAAAT